MFLYPKTENFHLNKGAIHIENRDPITILCILSSNCFMCKKSEIVLSRFPEIFPRITFAKINIDQNEKLLDMFNIAGHPIRCTPTYVLFTLGVFKKVLNIEEISCENLRKELFHELHFFSIIPKNISRVSYHI
nr:MAG: thioredoxin-like protein [Diabrotica toursvirus 3a]